MDYQFVRNVLPVVRRPDLPIKTQRPVYSMSCTGKISIASREWVSFERKTRLQLPVVSGQSVSGLRRLELTTEADKSCVGLVQQELLMPMRKSSCPHDCN